MKFSESMLLMRFYKDGDPFVQVTAGRYRPQSYLKEDMQHRFHHIDFLREPSHTYIPREILLFLEKNYALENQFGSINHGLLIDHIAQLIYEVCQLIFVSEIFKIRIIL